MLVSSAFHLYLLNAECIFKITNEIFTAGDFVVDIQRAEARFMVGIACQVPDFKTDNTISKVFRDTYIVHNALVIVVNTRILTENISNRISIKY